MPGAGSPSQTSALPKSCAPQGAKPLFQFFFFFLCFYLLFTYVLSFFILNARSKARDGTRNLMAPSWIHFRCATMGTPIYLFIYFFLSQLFQTQRLLELRDGQSLCAPESTISPVPSASGLGFTCMGHMSRLPC